MSIKDAMRPKVPSWADKVGRARTVGDEIAGKVVSSDVVPQYEFDQDTGKPIFDKPLYWDEAKTRPKTMPMAVIDLADGSDMEQVAVFFTGNAYTALKDEMTAMAKDGRRAEPDLVAGDHLTVKVVGTGTAKSRGFNPPLLYSVKITPGAGPVGKAVVQDSPSSQRSAESRRADAPASPTTGSETTRPDNVPETVWNKLSDEDKRAMTGGTPAEQEVTRPDSVPEFVWNKLSHEDRVAMAAGF